MANNVDVKDFTLGTARTMKTRETGSVNTPIHQIEDSSGAEVEFATETTSAAILAKLIAAPATSAKQDSIVTALGLLGTQVTSAAILAKLADPATQTTLAAVLAKMIVAPATEAKQDTANTNLATLAGVDFSTQTTSAAILAKITSDPATQTTLAAILAKIIAAPATEAKQDTGNTSLATVAGAVSSSKMATKAANGDFADGAIATIGVKADAKSTATDATAVSAMSVWKQISASAQAAAASLAGTLTVASHAVTNAGTFAVQATLQSSANVVGAVTQSGAWVLSAGSALIGKVGIDQTTPGTTDSVSVKNQGFSSAVSVTRPANTTAYAAGDVVGATAAAITFPSMGPSGKEIMITSAAFEIDAAAIISGETSYRLYLYNVTPPSALADNAAFDIPSGDRASFLGFVDLGTPVDLGSTLYVEGNAINKQLTLSGTSLFGYLVTNGAFTPTSARVHKITLHSVAV